MAYHGQTHIVRGACKTTHVARFPAASEMFQDEARQQIVKISLLAHRLFLEASLLPENDPRRLVILEQAIDTRLQEKARWLAMEPADQDGAWKADLAIASYLGQSGNMVAALELFVCICKCAPRQSLVYQAANSNLKQMFLQVRSHVADVGVVGDTLSTLQLDAVRAFWVHHQPK
jgi:hypothetical protein